MSDFETVLHHPNATQTLQDCHFSSVDLLDHQWPNLEKDVWRIKHQEVLVLDQKHLQVVKTE